MRRLPIHFCLIFLLILVFLTFPFTSFAQEENASEPVEPQAEGPTVVIVGGEETVPEARIQEPDAKILIEKNEELANLDSATAETMSTTALPSGTEPDDENQNQVLSAIVDISTDTGAFVYTIPIGVPPGRNGLTPGIRFICNSYLGNGWLGLGCSLDMGAIQRATKFGVDYSADDFVYLKDGVTNDLAARSDWGTDYFGQKIEEGFTKYYYNSFSGGWEIYGKDGRVYYLGSTSASRQESSLGVFKWCLDRVEDANDNYISIAYIKDQGQIYLSEIQYTGNAGMAPANSVKFYLEGRPDNISSYKSHSEVSTAKRLKTISVEAGDQIAGVYSFRYNLAPFSGHSQITDIKKFGADVNLDPNGNILSGTEFPPILLGWNNNPVFDFQRTLDPVMPSVIDNGTNLYFGDWNGDGITDFMWYDRSDGRNRWHINDGSCNFSYISSPVNKEDIDDNDGNIYFGDWNGDSIIDFMWYDRSDGRNRWYINDGSCNFSYISSPVNREDIDDNDGNIYFGDWNGDGITDFMWYDRSDGRNRWYINDGSCNFSYISSPVNEESIDDNDGNIYFGDWNGDGITDFMWWAKADGRNRWYINNGSCSFTKIADPVAQNQIDGETNRNLYFGDWNGDGITDFLYYNKETGANRWYINDGSCNFSYIFLPVNEEDIDDNDGNIYFGDWNGDGITDFMWYDRSDGRNRWYINDGGCNFSYISSPVNEESIDDNDGNIYFGDWSGDGITDFMWWAKADGRNRWYVNSQTHSKQMITATKEIGGIYSIEYEPSSIYTNTLLPFIIHPVSQITIDDGLGNLSTKEFSYSGGLYDFATREFRGFKTTTRTNPDGTIAQTKHHQDEFRKGRVEEESFWAAGADLNLDTPLVKTTNTWETEYLDAPDNTQAFLKLSQQRTDHYDATSVFNQQDFLYDSANGNLLSVTASGTGAESVTTDYAYANYGDWIWRRTQETLTGDTSGKVQENTFEYETGTGNLLAREDWLDTGPNPRTTFQYDTYGNVTHATDPRGNTTVTEYDPERTTFPVKINYPATAGVSHIVEMAWDNRYGKKLWEKDENGKVTNYAYDPFGRISQTDSPDGGQTTVEYFDDIVPRYTVTCVKETATGPTIDSYRYLDGLNREVQIVAFGEGSKTIVTKTFYDEMGRLFRSEGPFFATGSDYPQTPPAEYPWQETLYDDRGRPVSITSAHGQHGTITATLAYDGFTTTFTDPDGSQKIGYKDYLGRITRVTEINDTEQYHTDYIYNAVGDLKSVTDHLNNVTTVTWDTLGRKIAMDDPDMGPWSYTYDANGNLLTQTDAKNQTVTLAYDELNRVTTKSYSTSDPTVTYLYDNVADPAANGIGRLYRVSNGEVSKVYEAYDAMGRVLTESKEITGSVLTYTTRYFYDFSGKIVRTTHPDGYFVDNAYYPGTDLLYTLTGSDGTVFSTQTDYQPTGKMGVIDHDNGTRTTHTYDALSTKLTRIQTTIGATPLQDRAYQYSPAGDIEQIGDAVGAVTYYYTYDDLHRLTSETTSGGGGLISYTYDAIGNILTKTTDSEIFTYDYDFSHPHAVSEVAVNGSPHTFTYDANGNLTTGNDLSNPASPAVRSFTWNADNMPTSVTRAGVTTGIVYDGNGGRAKKMSGGSTTYYVSGAYEIVDGVATHYIFAGSIRIAKHTTTEVHWFHKDHLGSTTVMSDGTGTVGETAEYKPFGSMRSHTGVVISSYKYTDQEMDSETGLYNYNARLYDPIIGRFTSADTLVPGSFDPQALNRYSYCVNNPMIYVDPSGHFSLQEIYESAEDLFNPVKAFKDGGILGLFLFTSDPVMNSLTYTHKGGFGTSGGWSYAGFDFGGGWQQRGPNAGLYGYIGYGYTKGDFSAGVHFWLNQYGDYSIGANIGYKGASVKAGYSSVSGWSAGAGYKNGSIDASLKIVNGGFSVSAEYDGPIDIDASYSSNGSYSIAAKKGFFKASYSSNGGYSVSGLGMSIHGSDALIVTGVAAGVYGIAGDKADAWYKKTEQEYSNKVRDWVSDRWGWDISHIPGHLEKIRMLRLRHRAKY